MKIRLLDYLRCPACRGAVRLADPSGETTEVVSGTLACQRCGRIYPIRDGVPRMLAAPVDTLDLKKAETSRSFGYLWAQSAGSAIPVDHHFEKLARTLEMAPPAGLLLDAGCGEGIDLVNQAKRPGVEVIGVELSDGGCRTSAARIRHLPNAHVVQADLGHLPFADGTFDGGYSYGVLHHLAMPSEGLAELARVGRSGAQIAVYLYEDFSERSAAWRWLLHATNTLRHVTTRIPPRLLYGLCRVASPLVYLTLTLPYRMLRRVPGLRGFAENIPYRHGTGPFAMTGDLFDRFSAPVEYRYSREGAIAFLRGAGLRPIRVGNDRGWMLLAEV